MLPINRLLNLVPKRAESRQAEQLRDTFVDSGVAAALEAIDHQVLVGRRGTGKTHALRYLEGLVQARGGVPIYVDLRTVGSPEGLMDGESVPPTERAARLLVDMLSHLHDAIMQAALDDESLMIDANFVGHLDALLASITSLRVTGEVEVSEEGERTIKGSSSSGAGFSAGPSSVNISLHGAAQSESGTRNALTEVRRGQERIGLNFSDIARSLRNLADSLSEQRVWLMLDEWSSVPADIQPLLGEFLVRCILPLQKFTVKIGAIEQQTAFRGEIQGRTIGIEVGADVTANVNLDDFMVFEQNQTKARDFFRGLIFKHLTAGVDEGEQVPGLDTESDLLRMCFTDVRAFDEVVRAAEGVARDAINILGSAALHAGDRQVSVPDVRTAAQSWYQTDKAGALQSREEAARLLHWITDNVIRGKRARGFLVNQREAHADLLETLFDARVLHILRRGYSAQDEPGERYDVYVIDYGAYVDLMRTKLEPEGLLPIYDDEDKEDFVDVPAQDLRSLRRAVLRLEDFSRESRAAK